MALPERPITRQEMYLSRIAGEETELPDEPLTREEMYLEAIANGGGGGGYVLPIASADTLGGVKVGDSLSIDANGSLSVDSSSLETVKMLTANDYNYPENNPTSTALWLLPPGLYQKDSNSGTVRITNVRNLNNGEMATVGKNGNYGVSIHVMKGSSSSADGYEYGYNVTVSTPAGSTLFQAWDCATVDNLTSNSTIAPLSAKQGKALNTKIEALAGSSIKTLSNSDYDWPLNNPDGVALFRLPVGYYIVPAGLNYYYTSNQTVDRDYKVGGLVEVCYYQRSEELPDDPFVVYEVHDAAGKREGQVYYSGSGTLFTYMVQ